MVFCACRQRVRSVMPGYLAGLRQSEQSWLVQASHSDWTARGAVALQLLHSVGLGEPLQPAQTHRPGGTGLPRFRPPGRESATRLARRERAADLTTSIGAGEGCDDQQRGQQRGAHESRHLWEGRARKAFVRKRFAYWQRAGEGGRVCAKFL